MNAKVKPRPDMRDSEDHARTMVILAQKNECDPTPGLINEPSFGEHDEMPDDSDDPAPRHPRRKPRGGPRVKKRKPDGAKRSHDGRIVNITALAEHIGQSKGWIRRRMAQSDPLPHIRLPGAQAHLFNVESVMEWIDRHTVKPAPIHGGK